MIQFLGGVVFCSFIGFLFVFFPPTVGEMTQFDENLFEMDEKRPS